MLVLPRLQNHKINPIQQFLHQIQAYSPAMDDSDALVGKEYAVLKAVDEATISDNSACQLYQWLREVCTTKLLQSLGGPGKVVQVDESQFRHKPKVYSSAC